MFPLLLCFPFVMLATVFDSDSILQRLFFGETDENNESLFDIRITIWIPYVPFVFTVDRFSPVLS